MATFECSLAVLVGVVLVHLLLAEVLLAVLGVASFLVGG